MKGDTNMFERGEAAAVVVLCLRSAEKIHGDEAAQAFVDRLERSLRGAGLRERPVLPVGARRRPGYMRDFAD